jgi:hypothetical protein
MTHSGEMPDRASFPHPHDGQRGFVRWRNSSVVPAASRLVGLITIEAIGVESPPNGATSSDREDATLQQILIHLSGGAPRATSKSEAPTEPMARRLPCAIGSRWRDTTRVSANLDHLRAELQLALTDALGRIAGCR